MRPLTWLEALHIGLDTTKPKHMLSSFLFARAPQGISFAVSCMLAGGYGGSTSGSSSGGLEVLQFQSDDGTSRDQI